MRDESSPGASQPEPRLFAEVAVSRLLPGGTHGVYTYEVPPEVLETIGRGVLVLVPLQKRHVPGIVVGTGTDVPEFETRPIHSVPEPRIVLDEERLSLAEWIAHESASSVWSAVSLFLPPGLHTRLTDIYRLAEFSPEGAEGLTPTQRKVVDLLGEHDVLTIDQLRNATGQSLTTVIEKLQDLGVIEHDIRVEQATPGPRVETFVRLVEGDLAAPANANRQQAVLDALVQAGRLRRDGASDWIPVAQLREQGLADAAVLEAMVGRGLIEIAERPRRSRSEVPSVPAPVLTAIQAAAWSKLERALMRRDSTPQLLFGVTGSGKTEIYLRGVAWCLRHGRSAIILVPEIGLATQVVRRFMERFPGEVVVIHSQLTESQRFDLWEAIAAGEYRVVVGPRSALFAPVVDLGLIVMDEEHESTYKQDSEPRYHARRVAIELAHRKQAALVLGSATPAVESTWHGQRGEYELVILPQRVNPVAGRDDSPSLELPAVEIVDLKQELQSGNTGLLSGALRQTIIHSLDHREQAIVLLNRRGTSTVVLCRDCGHRVTCPMCDIPLVFHQDRRQMVCHRCDHREPPPRRCPDCSGPLDFFGAGTQRVEEEVKAAFRGARVMRWDQDSVRKQGGYASMLARVERREVDIVVGTQMVAKGFDLPYVTSIGVIQADTMLHLPDFRSGERTFQLLAQVAGRAGRRVAGSRVVVQTYTPDHYAIVAAAQHDYAAFYDEEIDFRERHLFPPFVRLVRYLYRHDNEQKAAVESEMMAREIVRQARAVEVNLDLLGPTPAFAAKVRGKFQWQIVLRSRNLEPLLDSLPIRPGWVVDVDPQSML